MSQVQLRRAPLQLHRAAILLNLPGFVGVRGWQALGAGGRFTATGCGRAEPSP
ncbi:hypothetical protein [Deinococcus humi]|uniref:Uncharacterized protein n=1 Tax=Deinococcus humi TaxID=662880 RepID=A0A7W8JTB8_9DEIO|nr:hypothetical protein [Deinococcus humi]MBB5362779.1 hypothetical protein [Deinococcus humi]